eukprot:303353_1
MGNQTKPFGVIHNAHFLLKVPQNHGIHGKFMRLGSVQFNTSDTTGSDLYTRSSDCFTCDADSDTLTAGTTVYDDANSDTYTYRCDLPTCGIEISMGCDSTLGGQKVAMPLGVCWYEGLGYWYKYGCCSSSSSKYPGRLFFWKYTDDGSICDDCESGCPLDSLVEIVVLAEEGTCGDYEQVWDRFDGWDTSDYITPPFVFQVDKLTCNDANTYDCDNLEVPDLDSGGLLTGLEPYTIGLIAGGVCIVTIVCLTICIFHTGLIDLFLLTVTVQIEQIKIDFYHH